VQVQVLLVLVEELHYVEVLVLAVGLPLFLAVLVEEEVTLLRTPNERVSKRCC
jgi:hypothetical protein